MILPCYVATLRPRAMFPSSLYCILVSRDPIKIPSMKEGKAAAPPASTLCPHFVDISLSNDLVRVIFRQSRNMWHT